MRSYQDGGEHYDGQIGSEPTPQDFLENLWAVMAECWRVLKPSGSCWINLGDKYAGSGGHNNAELVRARNGGGKYPAGMVEGFTRNAPKGYNKNSSFGEASVPAKSLMGLPWRFAIGCIDGKAGPAPWILRAEVVWSKPNGLPESVTDRVRRSHEQWFMFTKSPRYFAAVDEIREPHLTPLHSPGQSKITADRNDQDRNDRIFGNPLGKLPGSVWTIPSEPLTVPDDLGVDHFAAFPTEFPRRIILGWSPSGICTVCGEGRRPVVEKSPMEVRPSERRVLAIESGNANRTVTSGTMTKPPEATITGYECDCANTDAPTTPAVVLDPFGGTGTVAMVAKALGRHGISNDLSADYCRLAEWRTNDPDQLRKVQAKTYGISREAPDVHPNQVSMFDGEVA